MTDLGDVLGRPVHEVGGLILGRGGDPLGGVSIVYRAAHDESPSFSVASSHPGGAFRIRITPHPGAILDVRREGLGRAALVVPDDVDAWRPVVRLRKEGRARVRLVPAPRGTSDPSFSIALSDGSASWWTARRIVMSPEGEPLFLLLGLPAQAVVVRCRLPDVDGHPQEGRVEVVIPAGTTRNAVIRLEPTGE